jgi:hypothetical protein
VNREALLAALVRHGYSRALWVPSPERYWLRPGGLSVVSEEQALAEVAELEGGET